jgi:hypothetical protein
MNKFDFDESLVDLSVLGALFAMAGMPKVVGTLKAAEMINRKPQTLRRWACKGNGPIEPVRINGRLAWRVADLLALLNGGVK